MPKRRRGNLLGCFNGRNDEQPEIRYEPSDQDGHGVSLQPYSVDAPMPDITELEEKFTEIVVRLNRYLLIIFSFISRCIDYDWVLLLL